MPSRKPPSFLFALGSAAPPGRISVGDRGYELAEVYKHDFFAVTSRYHGSTDDVILKIGRRASFFGLPLGWIGKWHAAHESVCYRSLQDLDIVPAFLGRWGQHGFLHAHVPGGPLRKGEPVPDDFYARLRAGLAAMHQRGFAYVDLEKCENVLLGEDGRPYLIDFQIAWHWPLRWGRNSWPARRILRWMQRSDAYHLAKLQRRTRPDQMSAEALAASYRRPWFVRWHGWLSRPVTLVRRRLLARLDPRARFGERGRLPTLPPSS